VTWMISIDRTRCGSDLRVVESAAALSFLALVYLLGMDQYSARHLAGRAACAGGAARLLEYYRRGHADLRVALCWRLVSLWGILRGRRRSVHSSAHAAAHLCADADRSGRADALHALGMRAIKRRRRNRRPLHFHLARGASRAQVSETVSRTPPAGLFSTPLRKV